MPTHLEHLVIPIVFACPQEIYSVRICLFAFIIFGEFTLQHHIEFKVKADIRLDGHFIADIKLISVAYRYIQVDMGYTCFIFPIILLFCIGIEVKIRLI